ncbi:hypothetical protein D8674_020372 [Pyrus ussuriensis x Pyrus communis]|uniref:Uncharacterized protein n=1 Tax=Pyrus ussuriensis x Pyrus communis TaxID=2448454 RepID=A0A5N5HTP4_9ROSA|nr:hypothetical protein D8674_020372 [Pyrus ussuriensis x Pyrus communis]
MLAPSSCSMQLISIPKRAVPKPFLIYKDSNSYDMINEVTKECGFVLSSACELKAEDNQIYSIKYELFLSMGTGGRRWVMPQSSHLMTEKFK